MYYIFILIHFHYTNFPRLSSGYMSPEYAIYEQFSVKSNIYSLGILMLETIIGKRNNFLYESDCSENLLSYISTN